MTGLFLAAHRAFKDQGGCACLWKATSCSEMTYRTEQEVAIAMLFFIHASAIPPALAQIGNPIDRADLYCTTNYIACGSHDDISDGAEEGDHTMIIQD